MLSNEIENYYKKLAEVYIYGLACSECPFEKSTCVGHEEYCAKRIKITMADMMKEGTYE